MSNPYMLLVIIVSLLAILALLFPVRLQLNRVKFVAQALSFPVLLASLGGAAAIISIALLAATGDLAWTVEVVLWAVYVLVVLVRQFPGGLKNVGADAVGADLTVMGWNTLGDSVPVEYMRDAVLQQRPDAVGLPETTQEYAATLADLLTAAGYPMRAHTVGPKDGHLPHETSLLIKAAYGEYEVQRLNILGASTLEATPQTAGSPRFVAVHTVAPTFDKHAPWVADLKMLAQRYRGTTKTILVGDFNATATHMRGLGGKPHQVLGGLEDAASGTHETIYGTWPVDKPVLLGTQIDHVLHTDDYIAAGFDVLEEHDGVGSDHRAIVAWLRAKN